MKNNTIHQAVISSILSVTASSWAQTSVGLGRADFKENCATCHGLSGKGDGPMSSYLRQSPADLTTMAQRYGGKLPEDLLEDVIDGRWTGEANPHGSREMRAWGNEFKGRAMTRHGDSQRTAEWSSRHRMASLLRYLETIQVP